MKHDLIGRDVRILTGKCAGMSGRVIQEPMGAQRWTTVVIGKVAGVGLQLPMDELQLVDEQAEQEAA